MDDKDYQVPFPLHGKLNKLTLKMDRPQLSPDEIKKLEEAHEESRCWPRIARCLVRPSGQSLISQTSPPLVRPRFPAVAVRSSKRNPQNQP